MNDDLHDFLECYCEKCIVEIDKILRVLTQTGSLIFIFVQEF